MGWYSRTERLAAKVMNRGAVFPRDIWKTGKSEETAKTNGRKADSVDNIPRRHQRNQCG